MYLYWMMAVFVVGYFFIILEHLIKIEKATIALFMGIACWMLLLILPGADCEHSLNCLGEHLSHISQIILFLFGALAIVEMISLHKGFGAIASLLCLRSKKKMLWLIAFLTFFLSSILDNLTTTIVMITLLSTMIDDLEDRLIMGSAVVIAANAGGAWTPIGDVTTTMLWIGGQLSTLNTIYALFLPSLICMVVSVFCLSLMIRGEMPIKKPALTAAENEPLGKVVLYVGIAALILVPLLKVFIGLPPFMGILLGLSVLWLITDLAHARNPARQHLRMGQVFKQLDLASLLFFLGILLAINALESAKILEGIAEFLHQQVGNTSLIATSIGLASAVIDNVPLVAATMGMYDLNFYPLDHAFWQLIAFCAGTGGSILIIGSAAGVVFMALEKVSFLWYVKRISLSASLGYFAGIATYLMF